MQDMRHGRGFTLVELLIAMVVTGVVLAAVVTLAFALGSANSATDDMGEKQAQVRFATLRAKELISHSKLICNMPGVSLAIWRADDNNDGQININELSLIERGTDADILRLCDFPSSDTSIVSLSDIETLDPDDFSVTRAALIPQCSNVQFSFDVPPPMSKRVAISFDLVENDMLRQYEINSKLLCWAGNLLNAAGDALASDDD